LLRNRVPRRARLRPAPGLGRWFRATVGATVRGAAGRGQSSRQTVTFSGRLSCNPLLDPRVPGAEVVRPAAPEGLQSPPRTTAGWQPLRSGPSGQGQAAGPALPSRVWRGPAPSGPSRTGYVREGLELAARSARLRRSARPGLGRPPLTGLLLCSPQGTTQARRASFCTTPWPESRSGSAPPFPRPSF